MKVSKFKVGKRSDGTYFFTVPNTDKTYKGIQHSILTDWQYQSVKDEDNINQLIVNIYGEHKNCEEYYNKFHNVLEEFVLIHSEDLAICVTSWHTTLVGMEFDFVFNGNASTMISNTAEEGGFSYMAISPRYWRNNGVFSLITFDINAI